MYAPKHQPAKFATIAVRPCRRARRRDAGRATSSALLNGPCISQPAREPNSAKKGYCPAVTGPSNSGRTGMIGPEEPGRQVIMTMAGLECHRAHSVAARSFGRPRRHDARRAVAVMRSLIDTSISGWMRTGFPVHARSAGRYHECLNGRQRMALTVISAQQ